MALKNYAVVENGKVVNVVLFDPEPKENWVQSDRAKIGDDYDGKEFTTPPVEISVPEMVTALQGLLALDQAGLSKAYESWASDPTRTFAEKAFIHKAQNWRYDDDVLNAGCKELGISEDQKKQLFILAASL